MAWESAPSTDPLLGWWREDLPYSSDWNDGAVEAAAERYQREAEGRCQKIGASDRQSGLSTREHSIGRQWEVEEGVDWCCQVDQWRMQPKNDWIYLISFQTGCPYLGRGAKQLRCCLHGFDGPWGDDSVQRSGVPFPCGGQESGWGRIFWRISNDDLLSHRKPGRDTS